ncbi:MAG: hypothetical protein WA917_01905 [Comamonas sp.]
MSVLTQSNSCRQWHGAVSCFPLTTLIRLYEFLRNSREALSSFSLLANANIKAIIFPCFDIAACVVGGG